MKQDSPDQKFRVIIVGGGLGGLALASALDLGNIDFLLLEKRDVIDPAIGASMGLMGNGLRIVDQLGCYDDIADLSYGIKQAGNHNWEGALIHPRSDGPRLAQIRCGYESVFLDRQKVLQVLYSHLRSKSKILTSKRLLRVDHTSQGVIVHCEDGSSYLGDIVVGADGTYSAVRQQMWKAADLVQPGFISTEERRRLTSEYQVLFGISSATAGLEEPGNYDVTYMNDVSSMVVVGRNNEVYWFLFKKLDRVYHIGEIPRYTTEEAEIFAEQHAHVNIEKEPKVTFGDIWKHRKYYTLVATEEASYQNWTWGRFACLGDAVHKVTPNAGVGGNASFESAAALANTIKSLVDSTHGTPSLASIEKHLKQYEQSRLERAMEISKVANSVTRLQALKGFAERFTANYIIPNAGDALTDMMSDLFIGATKIDFLPPPPRSLASTMPFNPNQGITKREKVWYRMILCLPFIALSILSFRCMNAGDGLQGIGSILKSGALSWDQQSFKIPTSFYHISWIDNTFKPIVILFSSSSFGIDPVSWWQALSFLTDFGVLISIMLIESTRRSNLLTFAQIPFVFLFAAQFFGIGVIGPLYFGLHYTSSQIENFKASDHRLTNLAYTRTVLPVLAVAFYLPLFLAYLAASNETRYAAQWIWQLFPVWISLLQFILTKTVVPDTIEFDRIHAPFRDLSTIRWTVGITSAVSGVVWLYTVLRSPFSLVEIFIPEWNYSQTNWIDCIRNVLQYDSLFCWASAFLWLGYIFMDLKHAGMVDELWAKIIMFAGLTTLVFGPGATVGIGWLWREEVLATKRHKSAVITGVRESGPPKEGISKL